MSTYMFFKELQNTASIKKQEEYADHHEIPKYQRLGQNQYGRETCTDVLELINRPLVAGDELIVYNLFTIGLNRLRIYEVVQAYHKAQIQLHILDINYFDKVQIGLPLKSENDHFKLYSSILKVFINESIRQNQIHTNADATTRKPGRPKKDWFTIPPKVKEIIIHHDANLYCYPMKKAISDIEKIGYSVSPVIFKRLLKQYREQIKGKSGR